MHSVIARLPARDHLTRSRLAPSSTATPAPLFGAPRRGCRPSSRCPRPKTRAHAGRALHERSDLWVPSSLTSTDAAFRRTASSVRAPFDVRPFFTREPGARPRLSGLGSDCPRTRHPDDVSIRPRSQSVKRLPESPDPHRVGFDTDAAFARSFRHRSIAMGRRWCRCLRTRSLVFTMALARHRRGARRSS
jgi:hypothetical protein